MTRRRGLPVGARCAYSLRISTFFCVARSGARSRAWRVSSSSSTSSGSAVMSAPASSPSSRTSGLVNAACAGPRRPSTYTSRMRLALSASSA